MSAVVTDFLDWAVESIPQALASHPLCDFLYIALACAVLGILVRLLQGR